jgi:hypothetical protein
MSGWIMGDFDEPGPAAGFALGPDGAFLDAEVGIAPGVVFAEFA